MKCSIILHQTLVAPPQDLIEQLNVTYLVKIIGQPTHYTIVKSDPLLPSADLEGL